MLAVVATGYWDSPFVFSLLTAVAVAGFARGFGVRRCASRSASVAGRRRCPWTSTRLGERRPRARPAQWVGRARSSWRSSPATPAGSPARPTSSSIAGPRPPRPAGRRQRPAVLSCTRWPRRCRRRSTSTRCSTPRWSRLRDLFDFDAARRPRCSTTPTGSGTSPGARASGRRRRSPTDDLPPPAARGRCALRSLVERAEPARRRRARASPRGCTSGLYAVLPARGSIIGLLVDRARRRRTTSPTATSSCSTGFVEPAALAIDNARWFGRLRTVGADEERTRIARDLHDRIGQSLAYLAFELDRIVKSGARRRRRRRRRSTACATTSAG